MGSVLSEKDVNVPVQAQDTANASNNGKPSGAKTLEYHRQMLQSKMADEKYGSNAISPPSINSTTSTKSTGITSNDAAPSLAQDPKSRLLANINATITRHQQYISPSDSIMSPATAKLNALKGRVAGRIKPKSLFAQTSAKKLDGSGNNVFGSKTAKGPQEAKDSKDAEDPPTTDQNQPSQ
ncbi:hypothetical protein F4805DRAFT_409923 [Annulohypoxylon moriforme]|nr:hypothetical protein F4805DRAFT_409923 [Annulohypoxylon moriforme]